MLCHVYSGLAVTLPTLTLALPLFVTQLAPPTQAHPSHTIPSRPITFMATAASHTPQHAVS